MHQYNHTNTPYDAISGESRELLRERHERIRRELRTSLQTMLGISGGAVGISLTFLEKIAPKRHVLWLLAVSWGFLGITLLLSLSVLIGMTFRSIKYQDELKELYNRGHYYIYWTPGGTEGLHWWVGTERFPGMWGTSAARLFFVAGVACIAVFTCINLLK